MNLDQGGEDFGDEEALDLYAVGYVDGLARRPMADKGTVDLTRYSNVVIAFELGRTVERKRQERQAEQHQAGIEAEVIDLAQRLSERLQGTAPSRPGPCRPRPRPRHLRLVR